MSSDAERSIRPLGGQVRKTPVWALLPACATGACQGNFDAGRVMSPSESTDETTQAYDRCIQDADDRLDDGKSDVNAVAPVVSAQCEVQYTALKAAFGEYLDSDTRKKFEADMDAKKLSNVAAIVQTRRGSRAQERAQSN